MNLQNLFGCHELLQSTGLPNTDNVAFPICVDCRLHLQKLLLAQAERSEACLSDAPDAAERVAMLDARERRLTMQIDFQMQLESPRGCFTRQMKHCRNYIAESVRENTHPIIISLALFLSFARTLGGICVLSV